MKGINRMGELMPFTTQGGNDVLTNGLTAFTHVGAYTDLGTTEVAGGSYARQAVTWVAAASMIRTNNAGLSVPIPAGTTVMVSSCHSAITTGNLESWQQIGSTLRGAFTIDAATDLFLSKAHGLTTDDRVFFRPILGDAIPTGVATGTVYFVLAAGLTTDVFQVSTSSGGAALNVTVSSEGSFHKTVPNTFASAGNLTIAINQLSVDLSALS